LIAEKPIILYTTQLEGDFLGLAKAGVAEPAFTPEDLPKALDKVLYDKDHRVPDKKARASYLKKYALRPDGSGMTAVIDEAKKIIDKEGSGKAHDEE
jgi:hypothetical protein